MATVRNLGAIVGATVSTATNVAGVAIPGAPAAGTLVQAIQQTIEQVAVHRTKCAQLNKKCMAIKDVLESQVNSVLVDEYRQAIDELIPVLEKVNKDVMKWRYMPGWKLFFQSSKIETKLDEFIGDIDAALSRFDKQHKTIVVHQHSVTHRTLQAQSFKLEDLISKLDQGRGSELVDAAREGPAAIRRAMGDGQTRLLQLGSSERAAREHTHDSNVVYHTVSPRSMTLADRDPETSSQNSDAQHSEEYRLLKNHMRDLLQLGLPTEVAILDGQVTRSETKLSTSPRADVWRGTWLGRDVALKGYRNLKKSDSVKARFLQELQMWNSLHDDHVVQFYGITYDIGNTVYIVSAMQPHQDVAKKLDQFKIDWKEKGNIPDDFDRAKLMRGAAQGLAYLHSNKIVHGNVKCSKIYISADYEAKIGDFGMSKLLEEVKDDAGTVTEISSSRFSVPELFERDRAPDFQTDIWQFASSVLHCFSGEVPYHDIKRNGHVVREMIEGKHPNRPRDSEIAAKWITDEVWAFLVRCWAKEPDKRPTMEENKVKMFKIEQASWRRPTA